jgi:hypothetical protein
MMVKCAKWSMEVEGTEYNGEDLTDSDFLPEILAEVKLVSLW